MKLTQRLRSNTPNMTEGHATMREAAARIEALESALNVAMGELAPSMPGDSRAVPDWFVACASVQCDLPDEDGSVKACLDAHGKPGERALDLQEPRKNIP